MSYLNVKITVMHHPYNVCGSNAVVTLVAILQFTVDAHQSSFTTITTTTATTTTTITTTAWVSQFPLGPSPSSTCSRRELLGLVEQGFFALSNRQCQSSEGNRKHSP